MHLCRCLNFNDTHFNGCLVQKSMVKQVDCLKTEAALLLDNEQLGPTFNCQLQASIVPDAIEITSTKHLQQCEAGSQHNGLASMWMHLFMSTGIRCQASASNLVYARLVANCAH